MFSVGALRPMRRALVAAALAVLAACADRTPTEPVNPASGGSLDGLSSSNPKLVECPTDERLTTGGPITALGGTLAIGGTSVFFPAGAVLAETDFELTIPASRYVEVEINAKGFEHFVFEPGFPAVVTIDYSRCNRSDILVKPLSVWYIDSETKELKYDVGGVDNKLTRSITFTTPHLSGYAIAF
jgi:hypothetical protein